MANGADMLMSDQSSRCNISHSYRSSPLAEAEDLDAYSMFHHQQISFKGDLKSLILQAKPMWQPVAA